MDGDMTTPGLIRNVALYIDTPNIQIRGDGELRRYLDHDQVDWAELVSLMVGSLDVERCTLVGGLYMFRNNTTLMRRHMHDIKIALGRYREAIDVVGTLKDVDSRIIIDMWGDVIGLLRRWNQEHPDVLCEVTVLLASGDHIYADAVRKMREALDGLVRIRLHTFAWEGKIAPGLDETSEEVTLLDDLSPFVRL